MIFRFLFFFFLSGSELVYWGRSWGLGGKFKLQEMYTFKM